MLLLWPPVYPSSLTGKLVFLSTSRPQPHLPFFLYLCPHGLQLCNPHHRLALPALFSSLLDSCLFGGGRYIYSPTLSFSNMFCCCFFLNKSTAFTRWSHVTHNVLQWNPCSSLSPNPPKSGCQEGESSYFLSSSALPNCCFTILSHTFFEVHDITHSYSTPFMILPHTHQQLDHSFLLFCGYCNNCLHLQVPPSKAIGKIIFHPVSLVLFFCKLLIKAICSQFPLP